MVVKNAKVKWITLNGLSIDKAISKTTHMAIAAHPDDIEIMAYHGISECYKQSDKAFTGIVVTDGAGSVRHGKYKDYTDKEMIEQRQKEQKEAAFLGKYEALGLLNYSSDGIKMTRRDDVRHDLIHVLKQATPQILYTHNLADKHSTHVHVAVSVIEAIRELPKEKRPKTIYGCEVWRDLDWMNDEDKVKLNVSRYPELSRQLINVYDSQLSGGKRFDLATQGRRLANATYTNSHTKDNQQAITYAMDLTPLIKDDTLDIQKYVLTFIERFKTSVIETINRTKK